MILKVLQCILHEWDLQEENVIRFVTDQGANIKAALRTCTVNLGPSCSPGAEGVEEEEEEWDFEEEERVEDILDAISENERTIPKNLFCYAHVMSTACRTVLDVANSPIHQLKGMVLPLIARFSKSGAATEHLKKLAGKKLLHVAQTRWKSFFYVCNRLLELRKYVMEVCRERDIPILFQWGEVERLVKLIEPIARHTTLLEGDNYSTICSVLPALLTIKDHLSNPDAENDDDRYQLLRTCLLNEINRRFERVLNPNAINFDPIPLICAMLSPYNSSELPPSLY